MQRWMDFILANNPGYLRRNAVGNNFGDWLAPDEHTPHELIGTAYWALVAREMTEMANAIHRPTMPGNISRPTIALPPLIGQLT